MIDGDRIILQPDTLIEGWIVHEQDAELTRLGRWSGATGRRGATSNSPPSTMPSHIRTPRSDWRTHSPMLVLARPKQRAFSNGAGSGPPQDSSMSNWGRLARAEWEGLRPVPSKATPQEDEPAR